MCGSGLAHPSARKRIHVIDTIARLWLTFILQVRHLCFGWNHPQFAYALVTLASILAAIGNDFEADLMMRRQVCIPGTKRLRFESDDSAQK